MSKLVVVPVVLLAACAATGANMNSETAPRAKVQLDLTATGDTSRVFPAAKNPQLPTADRHLSEIRADVGDVASADINLCVSPAGKVLGVLLLRSSSSPVLDGAIIHDAPEWQFSEMPGASATARSLRTCETATITYRLHE